MGTDYPLVQITHDATGTVTYARTIGMTNRSIARDTASSTQFTLPTCTLGKVKHAASGTIRKGRVISQKPRHGSRRQHGAKVSLVISKGKR